MREVDWNARMAAWKEGGTCYHCGTRPVYRPKMSMCAVCRDEMRKPRPCTAESPCGHCIGCADWIESG